MSDYIKIPLSGRAGGKPIQVTATSLATAQTIHTAIAGTSAWDEIWLWVTNVQSTAASISISFGYDNTDATLAMKTVEIPPCSEPIIILAGVMLQNAKTVKAYASISGYINCLGYVKRI